MRSHKMQLKLQNSYVSNPIGLLSWCYIRDVAKLKHQIYRVFIHNMPI